MRSGPVSRTAATALLLLVGTAACAPPEPTAGAGASIRLIAPADETLRYFLRLSRLAEENERLDLLPRLAVDRERADVGPGGRIRLAPGRAPVGARVEGALDADEAAVLELRFDLRPTAPPTLSWRSDRSCAAGSRLDEPRVEQVDRDHIYVFPVGAHPCWRGAISELEWSIVPHHLQPNRLLEAWAIPAAQIAAVESEIAGRSWRLLLDGELRSGVVLTPSTERQWPLEPDAARSIRFAWGLDAVTPAGARLRFAWRGSDGRIVPVATVEVEPERTGRWIEASLELPEAAVGRSGSLRVSAELDRDAGAIPPLLLLADLRRVASPGGAGRTRSPVVLVSVDTLRADRLSMYGHHRATSPRIDAWVARHAVRYDQAVAQAPWTLPSHASMLTGLSTFRHGVNFDRPMPNGLVTLPEQLAAAGYRTIGVTGGAWMGPHFNLAQGFDVFFASPTQDDRAIELDRGIEHALRHLDAARGEPVFLFFHTYDVHGPHRPRSPWFEAWSDEDPKLRVAEEPVSTDPETGLGRVQRMRLLPGDGTGFRPLPAELARLPWDIYDSEISDMDSKVGPLLERIEADLGSERPIVVFTSDHGESLGEHGVAGHNNLYEEVVRVPLAIRFPDRSGAGRSVERQVRSIDIVPTILAALDLPGGEALDGAPLQPLVSGAAGEAPRTAWTHTATGPATISLRLEARLKLISALTPWGEEAGRHELFDLRQDPSESTNLAVARSEDFERLGDRVRDEIRRRGQGLFVFVESRLDEPSTLVLRGPRIERGRVRVLLGGVSDVGIDGEDGLALGVSPGSSRELWLEGVSAERVALRVGDGAARELDLESASAAALAFDGSAWEEAALDARPPRGGLHVRLVARNVPSGSTAGTDDAPDELRSMLRALGYL